MDTTINQILIPLIAGLAIAVVAPTIGMFTVLRRYALVADSLAHVVLLGVVIGSVVGFLPGIFPYIVAVLAAILVEYLREIRRVPGESALAMLLTGGVAAATTLASYFKVEINEDLLFGALEKVAVSDMLMILGIGTAVVVCLLLFWKELVYSSFDDEAARAQGLPVRAINMLLMIVTALTVTAAIRVVGVLLTGALTVIPVMSAIQLNQGFRTTAFYAICISVVSVGAGLLLALTANLSPGGAVVMSAFACFFAIVGVRKVLKA